LRRRAAFRPESPRGVTILKPPTAAAERGPIGQIENEDDGEDEQEHDGAKMKRKLKLKTSWREKLERHHGLPVVQEISGKMSRRWGEGTFVIPAPIEVDELMRKIPKGKLVTIAELREILARRHGATIACPITTGIFAWLAANVAEEDAAAGKRRITPYWRTLKTGGELNPKYPGGVAGLAAKLKAEGHRIARKGKRFFVQDYERALARNLGDGRS
jgi:hypothetical protein